MGAPGWAVQMTETSWVSATRATARARSWCYERVQSVPNAREAARPGERALAHGVRGALDHAAMAASPNAHTITSARVDQDLLSAGTHDEMIAVLVNDKRVPAAAEFVSAEAAASADASDHSRLRMIDDVWFTTLPDPVTPDEIGLTSPTDLLRRAGSGAAQETPAQRRARESTCRRVKALPAAARACVLDFVWEEIRIGRITEKMCREDDKARPTTARAAPPQAAARKGARRRSTRVAARQSKRLQTEVVTISSDDDDSDGDDGSASAQPTPQPSTAAAAAAAADPPQGGTDANAADPKESATPQPPERHASIEQQILHAVGLSGVTPTRTSQLYERGVLDEMSQWKIFAHPDAPMPVSPPLAMLRIALQAHVRGAKSAAELDTVYERYGRAVANHLLELDRSPRAQHIDLLGVLATLQPAHAMVAMRSMLTSLQRENGVRKINTFLSQCFRTTLATIASHRRILSEHTHKADWMSRKYPSMFHGDPQNGASSVAVLRGLLAPERLPVFGENYACLLMAIAQSYPRSASALEQWGDGSQFATIHFPTPQRLIAEFTSTGTANIGRQLVYTIQLVDEAPPGPLTVLNM